MSLHPHWPQFQHGHDTIPPHAAAGSNEDIHISSDWAPAPTEGRVGAVCSLRTLAWMVRCDGDAKETLLADGEHTMCMTDRGERRKQNAECYSPISIIQSRVCDRKTRRHLSAGGCSCLQQCTALRSPLVQHLGCATAQFWVPQPSPLFRDERLKPSVTAAVSHPISHPILCTICQPIEV